MKLQLSINESIIGIIKTKISRIFTLTLQPIKTHDTFYIVMIMIMITITYGHENCSSYFSHLID